MKPEVLFWALFFVIAVGLTYRLFDRASRRTKRAGDDSVVLPKRPAKTDAARTAPAIEASEPTRLTTALVAEPVAARPPPPSSAQPIQATTPSQTSEAPAPVLPKLVAAAAAAIAPRDRTVIVAPNVKATLPPAAIATSDAVVAAPDVKATLPPAPIAMSDTVAAAPDVKATLPPTAIAEAVTESSETVLPSAAASAVAIPATIRLRGTRLRARRIGQAMPPLDERIKETRSRKLRRRSKTRRKQTSLGKTPRKAPPRRIAVGPKGSDAFASTKAETKIVDAPPKAPRVLIPTVH